MYWYHYHPYYPHAQTTMGGEGKYATDYLKNKIGEDIHVVLNYSGSKSSTINQNVQFSGIFKEVGNDYIVVGNNSEIGEADIFIYTVNLARAFFPNGAEKNKLLAATTTKPVAEKTKTATLSRSARKNRR